MKTVCAALCYLVVGLGCINGALELSIPGLHQEIHAADLQAIHHGLQAELKSDVTFLDQEFDMPVAKCKVLAITNDVSGAINSTTIQITTNSRQPCSLHSTWISSPGHVVVINELEGCISDSSNPSQLVLRLQSATCSSAEHGLTALAIIGHSADSFDAFEKLSLKLYRGPGSMPQEQTASVPQNSSVANIGADSNTKGPDMPENSISTLTRLADIAEVKITTSDLSLQPSTCWGRLGKFAAHVAHLLGITKSVPVSAQRSNDVEASSSELALSDIPVDIPVEDQPGNHSIGRHLLGSGCDQTCATCSGSGFDQCSTCRPGWVLYQLFWFTGKYCHNCNMPGYTCSLSNSYCNLEHSVCYYCDQSCATCSAGGPSDCLSCPTGLKLEGGQCVACTSPQTVPEFTADGLEAYVTLDYVKVLAPQGWTEPVPTGLYFMSSHYSHRQGQLVTNQLISGQNLPLPCVDTFGVQYDVVNAIATLAYGESIRIGVYEPGGSGWFGLEDSSLGDAWVLNPADFQNGISVLPGVVTIRPVTTESRGLHVEMGLSCVGCLSLTGTARPAIDKSNPVEQIPAPLSVYNFNPQTNAAASSIPFYQGPAVNLACTNCFIALQQAALYLAVTYDGNKDGFENIQVEADVTLLANMDVGLSCNGSEDSSYTKPLVTDKPLLFIPFPVFGITFTASIDGSALAVLNVKGSGNALLTTGADASVSMQYGYSYDVTNGVTPYTATQTSQHSHTPTIKIPEGTTASFSTSLGLQPSLRAGLKGNVLWAVASGYVYATAQTLAHVDLDIQVNPQGFTVSNIPSTALVYGDCNASPAVAVSLSLGVDQAKLGIGLAAALLPGFPLIGWSPHHNANIMNSTHCLQYQKTWGPWPITLSNQAPGVLWPITQLGQACLCPVGGTECLINQASAKPPPPPALPSPPPPPPESSPTPVPVVTASPATSGSGNGSVTAVFTVLLGGVTIVDFNAQRQATFLQVAAGFMGVSQTLLKISTLNGITFNSRRKLAASSGLNVGVLASGYDSSDNAASSVSGFTQALTAGTLQSQMLSLSALSITSAAYSEQPVITTTAASTQAVNASAPAASKHGLPVGAIVGIAAGGAVLVAAAALAAFFLIRKRRRNAMAPSVLEARHVTVEAGPVAQGSAAITDKQVKASTATHVTASS